MIEAVSIERVAVYSDEVAAGIGRLMPFLSERRTDDPMDADVLQAIIDSPNHDQLVAQMEGRVVGAATMSLLMGPAVGRQGYLEDFVTDPAVRGQRIGDRLWQEMMKWCGERGADLSFTSKPTREAAHRFYLAHGATIRSTAAFNVDVPRLNS